MTTQLEQSAAVSPPEAVQPSSARPRRRTSSFRPEDIYSLVGAFTAALSFATLLYTTLAPLSGPIGFVIVVWLLFVAFYTLIVSLDLPRQAVKDKVAAVIVQSIAFVLLSALVLTIGYTLYRGYSALTHSSFFTHDMARARPTDNLDVGGVRHGIIATLEQISLAMAMTVPVGLACAVFLNEIPGTFSRIVRTVTEAMTALPSIITGLFIFAFYILTFHGPKSGFAASLAISVMMLPIIIRAADVVLRLVPGSLKEASYALGSGQWRTLWSVTLPTARSGLATAVILGVARGIGETSPVLLTAGFGTHVNSNPFNGPQPSLPVLAFSLAHSSSDNFVARGFGAAVTLLVLVLVLFVTARTIGGRGAGNLSRRQNSKAASRSRRDLARFDARAAVPAGAPPAEQLNVIVIDPQEPSS